MIIFKFGGASVKDASGVRNLEEIVSKYKGQKLCIVVSAMGKTTNALESVVSTFAQAGDWRFELNKIFEFHQSQLSLLLEETENDATQAIGKIKHYAFTFLEQDQGSDYAFLYDQIVPIGELLSTKIIEAYLRKQGHSSLWTDARKLVHTDNTYREAKVDWPKSEEQISAFWEQVEEEIVVTQGFLGGGDHMRMTTLGREGSDFSAAIFAYCLNAEFVTIWKDVPGMLNADPKYFSNTTLLSNISYREAIELSYYGASVIHPKTIKPLENKNIPLKVKSFVEPDEEGTLIDSNTQLDFETPSYIFQDNQVLISISSRDFSFIVEQHISDIFNSFAKHRLKIQTMQNSAISFSVSVKNEPEKIKQLIEDLKDRYKVLYNEGLELLTIRHFNEKIVEELIREKEVLLEQKTRHTLRLLMRTSQ